MSKPRVLILHTGGTLGMQLPEGTRLELGNEEHLARLTESVPELLQIADITLMAPWNQDSSDISPTHWQRLARTIVDVGGIGKPGQSQLRLDLGALREVSYALAVVVLFF